DRRATSPTPGGGRGKVSSRPTVLSNSTIVSPTSLLGARANNLMIHRRESSTLYAIDDTDHHHPRPIPTTLQTRSALHILAHLFYATLHGGMAASDTSDDPHTIDTPRS